jgi:predicted protein tyrosine phosphatase
VSETLTLPKIPQNKIDRLVVPVSSEAIKWADIIFVMEQSHKRKLSQNFQPFLKDKKIICLDIPDEYEYMEPALIELLKRKVLPLLGTYYSNFH